MMAAAAEGGAGTPVRFGPESNYGPFVYDAAPGRSAGLSVDLLNLAARRAGLQVTTLPSRPLHEWLQAARRGEVDLLSSLRPTPERAEFLLFTRPYVSVPTVLVVPHRAPGEPTLDELGGQRVAVGQGYAVEAVVRSRYPQVLWQAVTDDVAALRGVAEGAYRAAVVDAASLSYIQRTHGLTSLRIGERVNFDYTLSYAVRRSWPELRDRLDAAVGSVAGAERDAILERWLPDLGGGWLGRDALERTPGATLAGLGFIGVALGAGLAALWRRRVRGVAALPPGAPRP